MVDVISEGPRDGHVAVAIVAALGQALASLVAWGVAPHGIIKHLYWCETGIVLDWAGALGETGTELPQAEGLGDAERLAVTLAAVLHGLLSGKSPLEAPHIFLPISRFGHVQSEDLQYLLDTGLSGAAILDALLQLVDTWLAGDRLTYAFSPHVAGFLSEGALIQEVPGTKAPRNDWLLRLLFWGAGIFILLKYA